MKIEGIQEKITKKKQELEILEKELKEEESKQKENTSEWLDVSDVIDGYEIELNVHDKGKSYDDLGLKDKENKLLTVEQCIILANSKYSKQLKMDGSSTQDDFYIKQPFNINREKGYVANFYANGDSSDFYCHGDSWYSVNYRGVRLCRKKISRSKK